MLTDRDGRGEPSSALGETPGESRNLRRERKLWHDGSRNTQSIGCGCCPEIQICGGLRVATPLFDCLNLCCGNPGSCDRVCRNQPDFAARVREVATFSFDNVPRAAVLPSAVLPDIVPILFHGKRRSGVLRHDTVALSLYSMFDRRDGTPRFTSHEALCREYRVEPGTRLILTGTATDGPLERWWELGEATRRRVLRSLRDIGVVMATTPNYSVFSDQPRWNDMHAMKRILITHHEFLDEGVPAALHVNGRTDTDFRRWAEHVAARPEIKHLAYEFTTGTQWVGRRERHARWLGEIAAIAGRSIDLVVRGGAEVLPALRSDFRRVTVLNTAIFMKTMMRRRAVRNGEAPIRWQQAPTEVGAPLDELLADNVAVVAGIHQPVLVTGRSPVNR